MARHLPSISLVALLASVIPALAGNSGAAQDKVTFGQVAALQGPAAALGNGMRLGIRAAFGEVNKNGGVKGRKLELSSSDDGYEPEKSIEASKKLIDDAKVFALIGAVGTPTSSATQPITAAAGVPFIAPFTGAEFLRNPHKPNVVNIRASYAQETETMVDHLTKDLGASRIAIFYQDDSYGRAGLDGVQKALKKRNMELVAEGLYERNTTAVKAALLAIKKGNPQAVIMIGAYEPCAEFIKLARQIKMDATFVNISFVGSEAFAKALGAAADGVVVTQVVPYPYGDSPELVKRYQAALKLADANANPGFISLEGYIAGRLAIAALDRIEGEPTRQKFLDAMTAGEFDLGGLILSYSKTNNQGSNQVFLTVIQSDGSFKPVSALPKPAS